MLQATLCKAHVLRLTRSVQRILISGSFPQRVVSGSRLCGFATLVPPKADKSFTKDEEDYMYLSDKTDPRTLRYLHAEEEYFEEKIETLDLVQVQDELKDEFSEVTSEDSSTFLERVRRYDYYMLYPQDGNLPAFFRRHIITNSVVQLLDLNTITRLVTNGEKHTDYVNVSEIKVSSDDQYLGFTLSTKPGEEWYTLFVKDLVTGMIVKSGIPQVYSFEWGEEHDLFYTVSDALARPYKVLYHSLEGEKGEEDLLLYEEINPKFLVDVAKTRDGKFIMISSNSKTTSEVRVLDAKDRDKTNFTVMHQRVPDLQYFPEHSSGKFILVTNSTYDREFGLMEVPAVDVLNQRCDRQSWKKVSYRNQKDGAVTEVVGVTELDVFEQHAVAYRRKGGKQSVDIIDLHSDGEQYSGHPIDFKSIFPTDIPFSIQPGVNSSFNSTAVRLNLSCMIEPEISCIFDMKQSEFSEIPERVLPNSDIVCKTDLVESNGVKVPVTYSYLDDGKQKSVRPLLLTAYGAYGLNNEANYNSGHMSLVKRGWIVAHSHVRGGGEKGRKWYESGRALQKRNSFDDFVAVANYFINTGMTQPNIMAASAFSAGALILGVTANEHPGLFKVMIFKSPFLDVLDTMLDSTQPLTSFEFEEWGNPQEDAACFDYIKSYDPCKNVEKMFANGGTNPAMLVTSSLLDQRVRYWGPAKYVAKIRELSPNSENVVFNMTNESHFGAGGRFGQVDEQAFENAFLLHHLDKP